MVAWYVRASVFSFSRIRHDRTVDRIPAWAIKELIALTKKAYSISALWMLRTCVMALLTGRIVYLQKVTKEVCNCNVYDD